MDAISNFNVLQQFQTISRPVGAFQGSAPADQNGAVSFGGMNLQVVLAQMVQSLDKLNLGWNSLNGSQPERPLPFFAQLLEGQNRQPASPIAVTQAYPSDNEDGGVDQPPVTTAKYPSDAEDGGGSIPPRPDGPPMVTMAYPSDNEDGGIDQPPPIAVTMAYPSDNEDGGIDQPPVTTAKYPSDNEDGGGSIPPRPDGPPVNRPPVGIPPRPDGPPVDRDPRLIGPPVGGPITEKYPSDNEDGGVSPGNPGRPGRPGVIPGNPGRPGGIGGVSPGNPGRPGIQITMKFPSDQEDWRAT